MNSVKLVLFALTLAVLLTISPHNSASASSLPGSSKEATNCASVAELILFVAKENGYPPLRFCPRVSVTTDTVLKSIFVRASTHGEEPLAAFLKKNSEILLSPNIDLTTPIGRSYLVHEIVHVYQFEYQLAAPGSCLGLLELDAYRVQSHYLRTHNLPEDAYLFELAGMMQSSCANFYGH